MPQKKTLHGMMHLDSSIIDYSHLLRPIYLKSKEKKLQSTKMRHATKENATG